MTDDHPAPGRHDPPRKCDLVVRPPNDNANMRYLVMPMRPAETGGWSRDRLAELVTRDSMIGVSVARTP